MRFIMRRVHGVNLLSCCRSILFSSRHSLKSTTRRLNLGEYDVPSSSTAVSVGLGLGLTLEALASTPGLFASTCLDLADEGLGKVSMLGALHHGAFVVGECKSVSQMHEPKVTLVPSHVIPLLQRSTSSAARHSYPSPRPTQNR